MKRETYPYSTNTWFMVTLILLSCKVTSSIFWIQEHRELLFFMDRFQ